MYNFNRKPMTPLEIKIKNRIDDYLGECYEEYREDKRNGVFVEVENV
jgi:hypothetical protein